MNKLILFYICITVTVISTHASDIDIANYNETADFKADQSNKLLSRRKRFIVFPEGSSFQLVFEAQNHGYLQIGNIVWFSNTAALAWELPTDPQLLYMLKKETKLYGNRREDSNKHIYFLDEDGKVIGKTAYKRKFIVNPAFAKRSINGDAQLKNEISKKVSVKDMHNKEKQRNHFRDMDHGRIEFHRESRKDFYERVEKLLEGLGWNGKECVLRLLCETAKGNKEQGTFLEEIVRATFTLPRGRGFDSRLKYDVAHGTDGDCGHMYPECSISLM